LPNQYSCFDWLVTFSVASCDSLTDSDLQLFIETEQDGTRHVYTIQLKIDETLKKKRKFECFFLTEKSIGPTLTSLRT